MITDGRWKYVWNATDRDELYHLESDPFELNNLAAEPECAVRLAACRKRLYEWMEQTGDRLANNWIKTQLLEGRKL
ncbi:hypothetical protein SDC9_211140 [bioreactor metagenome]|uniref:N-sulphoglucosamine sulphohydrolase C-terminal domain-containing protein n=1 Tax=bioreactor metagenome TaxID=1076179 RepID=A0A645JJG8_9ZZZZ